MALRYGIDTSVLVRLVSREGLNKRPQRIVRPELVEGQCSADAVVQRFPRSPQGDFERCLSGLRTLVEERKCEVFASNQVVGEAYASLTHHYGASETQARSGLSDVLSSGLVAPLNGRAVLEALDSSGEPGLFDRLIADDYARDGLETLTLDRRMASLPGVQRL